MRAAARLPGQQHGQQAQPQTGCHGKDVRGKKSKLLPPGPSQMSHCPMTERVAAQDSPPGTSEASRRSLSLHRRDFDW